jgi:hypothetical protein
MIELRRLVLSRRRRMSSVEEIMLRLAAIIDELAALPEGFSPERFRLLTERNTLRTKARESKMAIDEGRSTESLEAELASLRQRRKSLVNSTGGYITGASADSAGRVGGSLTALRGKTGSAGGVDQLTVRITQIEDALATRSRDEDVEG